MVEPTLLVPSVPETSWKIATSIFCFGIFSIGLAAFVFLNHAHWDWFFAIWFGFTGAMTLAALCTWRAEIFPSSLSIVRTLYLAGTLPIWSKRYQTLDFKQIKRHVARARNYDGGSKGIFRPVIVLVGNDDKEVKLQMFSDCAEAEHRLSETWAERISNSLKLPLVNVVESWERDQ